MAYLHKVRIFYMILKQFSVCLMCLNSFKMQLIGKTKFVQWFIDLNFSFCSPEIHSDLFTDSFCILTLFNTIPERLVQISSPIHSVTWLCLNWPKICSDFFSVINFVTWLFWLHSQRLVQICSLVNFIICLIWFHSPRIHSDFFSQMFCNMTLVIKFPKDSC